MPKYFETFPKRLYDINNDGNQKIVTDIFRRLKVRDNIKDNLALFASYDLCSQLQHSHWPPQQEPPSLQ